MQVSIIRLADDSPRIEVAAAWSPKSEVRHAAPMQSTTMQSAGDRLHTTVRLAGGEDLTIEQIAVEQNSGETRTSLCFAGASLHELESDAGTRIADGSAPRLTCKHVASAGRSTIENASLAFELPAGRFSARDVPIVVKVVAADRFGRRTSAWASVSPHAETQPERLAQHGP
jgi:hypothetical protein